jgi:predicted O-methyltransferase YrrM
VEDHGAGSIYSTNSNRTVASIAKHAAKNKKYAQLLYRIVRFYKPGSILELGTSLGISGSYLALANPKAKMISIEGSPMVADKARNCLNELGISNCEIIEGNFDQLLPGLLDKERWELVFVDGNHKKQPTLRYFQWLMGNIRSGSILIFDDIHWSGEMEEAWEAIKQHPGVKLTIDLFFIGLVFFREEFHEKQDFTIRF